MHAYIVDYSSYSPKYLPRTWSVEIWKCPQNDGVVYITVDGYDKNPICYFTWWSLYMFNLHKNPKLLIESIISLHLVEGLLPCGVSFFHKKFWNLQYNVAWKATEHPLSKNKVGQPLFQQSYSWQKAAKGKWWFTTSFFFKFGLGKSSD